MGVRGLGVGRGGGLEVRRSAVAGFNRGTRLVACWVRDGGVSQAPISLCSRAFEVPAALFLCECEKRGIRGFGEKWMVWYMHKVLDLARC